jgi:hypothetical protein
LEKDVANTDKDRKALCGSGVLLPQSAQEDTLLLRFVEGRPVSQVTCDFLAWLAEKMTAQGKQAWC